MKSILTAIPILLALICSTALAQTSARPNVILIYADDLGPGMLSCNGQEIVTTPNIDRIAREGMSFNNYYGSVFCAPARWTLLTGMHDGRIGGHAHTRAGLPILRDSGEISEEEYRKRMAEVKAKAHPIAENEVFLAEVARQAGYKTAQFGKLDRGFLTWHERVKRFGWDFYEGMYDHVRCHGFYPPYIWRNGEKVNLPGNPHANCGKASQDGMDMPVGKFGKTYSQNVFLEGILKYLREHGESERSGSPTKPFFLYHPTQLPHGPVAIPELHPDYANDARLSLPEKKYASMVKMLDDHVGLIMEELKTQGLDENTIVFFISDNGHEMYSGPFVDFKKQKTPDGEKFNLTDNKFRTSEHGDVFNGAGGRAGLKRSGYQGGIQCVMMTRWPERIAPSTQSDLLTAHYDFMSTLADIGGVAPPEGKDSVSYLPTLLGKPQTKTHDYVIVHNNFKIMGGSSIITGDGWKLVNDNRSDNVQLYRISDDNDERFNLALDYSDRVIRLNQTLKRESNSQRPDLK